MKHAAIAVKKLPTAKGDDVASSEGDPGEEGRQELSPEEAWLAIGRLTRSLWSLTDGAVGAVVAGPRGEWPVRLFPRGELRDDGGESR